MMNGISLSVSWSHSLIPPERGAPDSSAPLSPAGRSRRVSSARSSKEDDISGRRAVALRREKHAVFRSCKLCVIV